MTFDPERFLEAAAFLAAGAFAGWTAKACRRASRGGSAGADARIWALVALLFLGLACARIAYAGPWLGGELRRLARASQLYGDRRPLQIVATVALAAFAFVALTLGLRSIWNALKRYRLAAASVAIVLASAMVRFVSLHEVDAWNRQWPWIRVAVDLGTSALASAAAFARLRQLAGARPERSQHGAR